MRRYDGTARDFQLGGDGDSVIPVNPRQTAPGQLRCTQTGQDDEFERADAERSLDHGHTTNIETNHFTDMGTLTGLW